MECPFCEHSKAHQHGQTSKGSQRYRCPVCAQTFTETLDTLYYRRKISSEKNEHPRRKRTGYHFTPLTHFVARLRSKAPFGRCISLRRKRRGI